VSIKKYKITADNSITDGLYQFSNNRSKLANNGAADSLELFSLYASGSDAYRSRILLNFSTENIIQDRQKNLLPSEGNVKFFLNLYNVAHEQTLARDFYASILPISSSWDEGYGLDLDLRTDIGQTGSIGYGSNWIWRTKEGNSYAWNQEGGDFIYQYEKNYHFKTGLEDLSIDVTNIIEDQIKNIIPRNGIAIKISGSYEDGSRQEDYYTKRFSARSSEYFYKVPTINAYWEEQIKDDRGEFYYSSDSLSPADNSGSIYFFNKKDGILTDVYNNPTIYVKILNSDNQILIDNITVEKINTGSYKAQLALSGSEEEDLKDVWYSSNKIYYTGVINAKSRQFEDSLTNDEYVFSITNIKQKYDSQETALFKIFSRKKNWNPNIYKIANTQLNSLKFNNLYYKITRIIDNSTVLDYGIEPIKYTKCGYDKNGNFFNIDMSMFEPGYMYEISLMLLVDDQKNEIKDKFKFKVE